MSGALSVGQKVSLSKKPGPFNRSGSDLNSMNFNTEVSGASSNSPGISLEQALAAAGISLDLNCDPNLDEIEIVRYLLSEDFAEVESGLSPLSENPDYGEI